MPKMPVIKTKQIIKNIKILDKTTNLSKNMRNAYVRAKEKSEETQHFYYDNPQEYATQTATNKAKQTTESTIYKVERFGRKSLQKAPDTIQQIKNKSKDIKRAMKGTVKTSQKTVKTAKATIKTSQQTAKATAKKAQKAVQAAKLASKATAQAAKVTVKAVIATVNATIAAVKGLITLIAAGGWIAVIIILIICMIALIISSPFGIFSGGGANQTPTIQEVVSTINGEWNAKVTGLKTDAGEVDEIIIKSNNEIVSSTNITNWADVLSVFSVLIGTGENPENVVEIDANKISKLKEVFYNMNTVTSQTEQVVKDDKTITRLTIEITSKSYLDMITVYDFNTERQAVLNELMSKNNKLMFEPIINN